MPTLTVHIRDELKKRMDAHPEIDWEDYIKQCFEKRLAQYEKNRELIKGGDV